MIALAADFSHYVGHHNKPHRPHVAKENNHQIHIPVALKPHKIIAESAESGSAESRNRVEYRAPKRVFYIVEKEIGI